ncbi:MAG: N-acetylglucosamine-6-phosphate deacetylase [Oscillospiraceae bacterium]|nr:N-acetylglucosamine-6-phosphate deacetylase [Oscillospiraceae bacterium]
MLYRNANIFTGEEGFLVGSFAVEDGRFASIIPGKTDGDGVDLQGATVLPGLIDVHNHGNSGADFSDGDYEGLVTMARFLAQNGVTSFAPASMTLPYDVLAEAFAAGVRLKKEQPKGCSRIVGINMEGPFFSEKKKGAQNADYLRAPDFNAFQALYNGCDGLIRLVDLAPELPGAVEFTRKAKNLCTVSEAHTDAGYDDACAVFDAGATHITHLFNAMPGIHHRKPGVIGAGSERENVVAELICDGFHVHPSAVRLAFRLFPGRICLISDALRCTGMPDGDYPFGGQTLTLKNGEARMPDGAIAGSTATLYQCMCNAVSFGIPVEEAIRSATIIPAREVGCDAILGSVSVGKLADFIVCDEQFQRKAVYMEGELFV